MNKYLVTINKDKNGRNIAFRVNQGLMQMRKMGLAKAKLDIQTGKAKQIDWKPITRLEW